MGHGYRNGARPAANRQFRGDGVEALVTTEKDLVDLCEEPGHLLAPLPLYWLRIGVQIDREDEFLDAVSQRLGNDANSRVAVRGAPASWRPAA